MSEKVYLNGELLDLADAKIQVSNPSLLHGVGLFETLRTYDGRAFRLPQHIDRLKASADRFNMLLGGVTERMPDAVAAVLDANQLADARVRITVTPPSPTDDPEHSTLLVTAQQHAGYPTELYAGGMTVYVCTTFRQSSHDPLAGHKTTSFFPRLLALRHAQEKQCGEALWFTPDNHLAEGCVSNVFLVKDGTVRTPPLDTPILPGVTRAAVLELAGKVGIPTEEAACSINDLLDADELFLTNAAMEVMPVTRVEGRSIADANAGPITRTLADAYRELSRSHG